jgi:hypothetical protein
VVVVLLVLRWAQQMAQMLAKPLTQQQELEMVMAQP